MSAPLRIRREASKAIGQPSEGLKPYLDRLIKLIPAEVLSLYAVGSGVISDPKGLSAIGWAVFCVVAVAVVRIYGTSDQPRGVKPDLVHTALSVSAFVIWVYYLGGPFEALPFYSKPAGSLLILGFTFLSPYLYRGAPDA